MPHGLACINLDLQVTEYAKNRNLVAQEHALCSFVPIKKFLYFIYVFRGGKTFGSVFQTMV